MNDDDLAAAAASGEQRAFGVIFERYHEPLYRYCAAVLDDSELAAATLQATMLAAIDGLKEGERSIALRPWLHGIAHEQSLELLAKRGSEAPSRERCALLLHEMNDLEYAEVGAVLGITTTAARHAVREARRQAAPAGDGRAQLGRELRELYALPPEVAVAVLGAGQEAIGGDEDHDRPRHRVLLAFLVLGVLTGSVAALAALGTFDSGGGGGGRGGRGGQTATPIQVAPGAGPAKPGGSSRAKGKERGPAGGGGSAGPGTAAAGGAPGSLGAAGSGATAGTQADFRSSVSAYTTPGERIEGVIGSP